LFRATFRDATQPAQGLGARGTALFAQLAVRKTPRVLVEQAQRFARLAGVQAARGARE
jgi:hypothetical protein